MAKQAEGESIQKVEKRRNFTEETRCSGQEKCKRSSFAKSGFFFFGGLLRYFYVMQCILGKNKIFVIDGTDKTPLLR